MTSKLGPSLELQGAYIAVLTADAPVKSLIGTPPRINPTQAPGWTLSYIMLGESQEVPDLAECIDGSEVFTDIHIWSRKDTSFADVKKIAATIWDALSNANLALVENRCLLIERDGAQYLRDPDGTTLHGILTVRAATEPAA